MKGIIKNDIIHNYKPTEISIQFWHVFLNFHFDLNFNLYYEKHASADYTFFKINF